MNYNGKRQRYNENTSPNIDQKKKLSNNKQRKKKKPENFMPPKGTDECYKFIKKTTEILLKEVINSFKTKSFPYINSMTVFCINNDRFDGLNALEKLTKLSNEYTISISKYNSWQHGGRAIGINVSGYIVNMKSKYPISMTFFFTHNKNWTLRSLSIVSF